MRPPEIATVLNDYFPGAVEQPSSETWQVETPQFRLLVLLSEDRSWLRLLIPIAAAAEAEPFRDQILEANFDFTQTVRYAISQNVLWGVFHHATVTLNPDDLREAIARLIELKENGLDTFFNDRVENDMRQIIRVSKQQGQSLEATMQIIDRFYSEGILGGIDRSPEQRERVVSAWRNRLEQLWDEEEVDGSA